MPIEIRELVIKAIIDETTGESPLPAPPAGSGDASEELVNLCVSKVLELLRDKMDR